MKSIRQQYFERAFDILWSALILLGVTLGAVYIPLRLVRNIDQSIFSYTIATSVTTLFILDIGYNFYVALRRRQNNHRRDRQSPIEQYIRRRLAIDVLAALPLPTLLGGYSAFILIRLIKMIRVRDIFTEWQRTALQYASVLRLVFLAYWLFIVAHWVACGWIYLHGAPVGVPFQEYYIKALYWSVTTLATVGYGDITPKNNTEMMYAIFVMLLGMVTYGYVVGNIANLLANLDANRKRYYQQSEKISAFMQSRKIPRALQRRISDYYAYYWERQVGEDESVMLNYLPPRLRSEVMMFLRRDILSSVGIFGNADENTLRDIAKELRPMLFAPGDIVCRLGEPGTAMYFINNGTLEVLDAEQRTIALLEEGDLFGEIALLLDQPRTATVRARDYCDVYALEKQAFDAVLAHHPLFRQHIRAMAHERQNAESHDSYEQ
ncbi:MAG: cyclic nucleotide-binding domain-containing protein [Ignavibacteria bacterium]|nr:cyclic nucleotide-binding domain-containing protein [Ignavibacteria bacterium]MBL7990685.1 cyclic nucleotide-binding domain-containing protein [Candidatus Kapabacteria bacterium]